MNSMISKKSILNLVLCIVTAFTLTSCSSASRDPAAEEQAIVDNKDSNSPVGEVGPQRYHGKRFVPYNDFN